MTNETLKKAKKLSSDIDFIENHLLAPVKEPDLPEFKVMINGLAVPPHWIPNHIMWVATKEHLAEKLSELKQEFASL